MADTPDIVIRTTEERLADERSGRYLLTELPGHHSRPEEEGTQLIADQIERKNATEIWVFPNTEGAVAWAALRAREIAAEGGEVSMSPYHELAGKFPDSRTLAPLADYHERALKKLLKW